MNIAYVVPNLQQTGPIIVVQSLVKFLANDNFIVVYYIDECNYPIAMGCETKKIFYDEPFPFDDYDIIHCHTAKSDLYAFFWMNDMHHPFVLTTIHQDSFYTEKLRLGSVKGNIYTHMWLKVQRQFDGQITISKQIKNLYQKYFPKEINVIYNGVNCEDGELDKSIVKQINDFKRERDNSVLLGTYALITKRKGLIQVLRLLVEKPKYQFLVIGDGPEVGGLKQFAVEKGISDRVLFVGHIDKPYNYLDAVDIYVMPSYSEAFGLAVVEAALRHKAIACSELDSFHEIFHHNEVEFFKHDDVLSMDAALQKLYHNKCKYEHLAFERVNSEFSASIMAQNTIGYYHKLINMQTGVNRKFTPPSLLLVKLIKYLFCLMIKKR